MLPIRPCMTILQNHLTNNLFALDTSPLYKVLMGSVESFVNHPTTTTVTHYTKLPKIVFPLLPKSGISKI
jgi:hypothetical protein